MGSGSPTSRSIPWSPPQILKRGVIELQFNQTSDLHTFDSQGASFDP